MLDCSENSRQKHFEEDRGFVREGENGRGNVNYCWFDLIQVGRVSVDREKDQSVWEWSGVVI
jgi:hypothetical protein